MMSDLITRAADHNAASLDQHSTSLSCPLSLILITVTLHIMSKSLTIQT